VVERQPDHLGEVKVVEKLAARDVLDPPRRRRPRRCTGVSIINFVRDENRRDIGKFQSKWTAYKMETPGSPKTARAGAAVPFSPAPAACAAASSPLPPSNAFLGWPPNGSFDR
jgi:hypothetical protein